MLELPMVRARARVKLDIARTQSQRLLGRFLQDADAQTDARVIANSLPKSGTHLLAKVLSSLPHMRQIRLPLYHGSMAPFRQERLRAEEPMIPAGIEQPEMVSAVDVRSALSRFPRGTFTIAHMPYSSAFAEVLADLDFMMVLIIRDPRDVVVSGADYLPHQPKNALAPYFAAMTPAERLSASLQGMESADGRIRLPSIRERLEMVLAWRQLPSTLVVTYEELVGARGGGSAVVQRDAVARIARHVGVRCTAEQIGQIADRAFGGTSTFNAGRAGRWQTVLSDHHRAMAGELLSDRLIELGYERDDRWHRSSTC